MICTLLDADLRTKADPILRNAQGECALEIAIKGRRVAASSALLRGDADPNSLDSQGERLLSCALLDQLEWGHGDISRMLKEHGAFL